MDGADEAVIVDMAKLYPGAAACKDKEGDLPIHYAFRNNREVSVVKSLLEAYPDGVSVKDKQGCIALHYALENGAAADVVLNLLHRYPNGSKVKNKLGDLALHDAVRRGMPLEVVSALVELNRDAIVTRDKEGSEPVHLLFSSPYSTQDVCTLLVLFLGTNSAAANAKDESGSCVLHNVVKSRKYDSERLTQRCLEACALTAQAKNSEGDLPLHVALKARAPAEIVLAVMVSYPDGLRGKSR
jgi:hypothetical protein